MKCPHCDRNVTYLVKCGTCAYVVCTLANCKGAKSSSGAGSPGSVCKICRKGKLVKI